MDQKCNNLAFNPSMGCGNPMNLKDGEESYQECQESFTNHRLTITEQSSHEVVWSCSLS
ncbi:hypothetical protein HanIR_Chr09g0421301 [Helianthus annuus]|nr:hypothetical protein HanIR_Chr09g0421301 [Helianthus annuus]